MVGTAHQRMATDAAAGGLLGAGWGVLARIFMRCLATEPAFSWSATLAILGLSAVLGAGLGAVRGARRRGGRRWWLAVPVPGLLLFAGPGALLLPALAAGLVAGRVGGRWVRRAVVVAGAAGALALLGVSGAAGPVSDPYVLDPPGPVALVPGLVLFAVAALLVGLGASTWTGPWVTPPQPPAPTEEADLTRSRDDARR